MNMLRESSRSDARAAIITTLSVALGIALLPAGSYLAYRSEEHTSELQSH